MAKRTVSDTLALLTGMLPGVTGQSAARKSVQRLLGYWIVWVFSGCTDSVQPMVKGGYMGQANAYRQRQEFEVAFGCDVSQFAPELTELIRNYLGESNADQ